LNAEEDPALQYFDPEIVVRWPAGKSIALAERAPIRQPG